MTNDIAIKFCDEYLSRNIADIDKEFLKIAKEALQQQSCDDCVSRQAVLDLVNADWKYEGLEEPINSLPPVTPQLKTGHWIFVDKAKEHARCSKCGYGDVDLVDGRVHDYCEKCGARIAESPVESEGK